MKWLLAVLCFVLLTGCANTQKMSKQDWLFEGAYQTVHWIDWYQTRNLDYDKGEYELNPILGKHPSNNTVDAYFITTGLAHMLITNCLPEKYRSPFQYLTLGFETGVVIFNIRSLNY